jgi:hypothetical protein
MIFNEFFTLAAGRAFALQVLANYSKWCVYIMCLCYCASLQILQLLSCLSYSTSALEGGFLVTMLPYTIYKYGVRDTHVIFWLFALICNLFFTALLLSSKLDIGQ